MPSGKGEPSSATKKRKNFSLHVSVGENLLNTPPKSGKIKRDILLSEQDVNGSNVAQDVLQIDKLIEARC